MPYTNRQNQFVSRETPYNKEKIKNLTTNDDTLATEEFRQNF